MKIILPEKTSIKIIEALKKAGVKEVGGILLGEHISDNEFLICDVTIQKARGGFAFFERVIKDIIEPLKRFFAQTRQNYKRFNYLGEWHSHPNFNLQPSLTDHSTMEELIGDEDFVGNFVVLMIVKLNLQNKLDGIIMVYQKAANPYLGELIIR